MSNHNITTAIRWLVISIVVFVLGAFTMSGIQAFMEDEQEASTPSSFLTARLEMPKLPTAPSTAKGEILSINGRTVFVRRDCANKMAVEAPRLYGLLAERVGNNGLTVTVPRGSSVWQELEAIVLDEQLGHGWPGNDPGYKDRVTASTLDERERIVGNLLEALRRQEGDSLTVVPAGVTLDLRAQHG